MSSSSGGPDHPLPGPIQLLGSLGGGVGGGGAQGPWLPAPPAGHFLGPPLNTNQAASREAFSSVLGTVVSEGLGVK